MKEKKSKYKIAKSNRKKHHKKREIYRTCELNQMREREC